MFLIYTYLYVWIYYKSSSSSFFGRIDVEKLNSRKNLPNWEQQPFFFQMMGEMCDCRKILPNFEDFPKFFEISKIFQNSSKFWRFSKIHWNWRILQLFRDLEDFANSSKFGRILANCSKLGKSGLLQWLLLLKLNSLCKPLPQWGMTCVGTMTGDLGGDKDEWLDWGQWWVIWVGAMMWGIQLHI